MMENWFGCHFCDKNNVLTETSGYVPFDFQLRTAGSFTCRCWHTPRPKMARAWRRCRRRCWRRRFVCSFCCFTASGGKSKDTHDAGPLPFPVGSFGFVSSLTVVSFACPRRLVCFQRGLFVCSVNGVPRVSAWTGHFILNSPCDKK